MEKVEEWEKSQEKVEAQEKVKGEVKEAEGEMEGFGADSMDLSP